MKCPECDGQRRIIWTFDGGTRPGYPWTAQDDQVTCGLCKGTGEYTPKDKDDVPRRADHR